MYVGRSVDNACTYFDMCPYNDFSLSIYNELEWDCLNSNFTKLEIEASVDNVKCDKSRGAGCVPVEFSKSCKLVTSPWRFNYIIEEREFLGLATERCWLVC